MDGSVHSVIINNRGHMTDRVRTLFERLYCVDIGLEHELDRNSNGKYVSDQVETEWQTFEQAFKYAVQECAASVRDYVEHRIPASQYSSLLIKRYTIPESVGWQVEDI